MAKNNSPEPFDGELPPITHHEAAAVRGDQVTPLARDVAPSREDTPTTIGEHTDASYKQLQNKQHQTDTTTMVSNHLRGAHKQYGHRLSAEEALGLYDGKAIRAAVARIMNDPIAWGEALGYKGTRSGRKQFGDFHRHLLANAMNNVYSSTMCPRGHGKSTLLSVVYSSWCLLRNPEERILIACAGLDLAEKLVGEVRARLMGQLELLPGLFVSVADIFPHMRVVGNSLVTTNRAVSLGACQSFNIAGRTSGLGREASMFAGSVGSSLAGNHPTMAVVDDPSTEQNCRTYGGRQTVIDFLDQLVPLMYEPGVSKVCHIGTCWANDDVSSVLRDRKDWHQVRYGVYDRVGEEPPVALCDSYMTLAEARDVEDGVKPSFFAAQYLNEPIPDDVPIFTADLLNGAKYKGVTLKALEHPKLKRYPELLLFDPVGRMEGSHGSKNGLIVVRPIPAGELGITEDRSGKPVAANRNIFVMVRAHEIEEGLEAAVTWIEQELSKVLHPNLKTIWIERLAQQAVIGPWLEERGKIAGIRVLGHKPSGIGSKEGKYMRVLGIQAALRRGLLVFPSDGFPGKTSFFKQLKNYPKVDFDDMLMATALLSNMLERKGTMPGMPAVALNPHTAVSGDTRRGRRQRDGLW